MFENNEDEFEDYTKEQNASMFIVYLNQEEQTNKA